MHRLRTGETHAVDAEPTTTVEPSAELLVDNTDNRPTPVDFDELEEGDFVDDMPDEDDLADFDAQIERGGRAPPTAPIFEQAVKRRRIASESSDDDAFDKYLKAQKRNTRETAASKVGSSDDGREENEGEAKENMAEEAAEKRILGNAH